jgi:hypothetical protein
VDGFHIAKLPFDPALRDRQSGAGEGSMGPENLLIKATVIGKKLNQCNGFSRFGSRRKAAPEPIANRPSSGQAFPAGIAPKQAFVNHRALVLSQF